MEPPKKIKSTVIISSIIFTIIIIIGILGAMGFFQQNPFGEATTINNFSKYFKEVPTERKEAISSALYTIIAQNIEKDKTVPTSGAIIRDNSVNTQYIEESLSNFSTFIVDIESIQQSYYIQMSWSDNPNNTVAGYQILITCPTQEQLIYPAFSCQDMLTEDPLNKLYNQNPIIYSLPIVISYYPSPDASLISYRISYKTINNNSQIKLIINDYTGGNYNRAIQTLKDRGIQNPEQYEIEYIDDSKDEFIPPPDRE